MDNNGHPRLRLLIERFAIENRSEGFRAGRIPKEKGRFGPLSGSSLG